MSDAEVLKQICSDLGPFADLGTSAPVIVDTVGGRAVRLVRNGDPVEVEISGPALIERVGSNTVTRHASFRALLASDRYGALRSWAAQQNLLLSQEVKGVGSVLEHTGTVNNSIDEVGLERVDEVLKEPIISGSTRILLVDGPAGIGKTNFIINLALIRSREYSSTQAPLLLHVESRGRQLSYIFDLIAFSLQRLRSTVTFDQVPVLVRHGLVTIAIDGFDELADPNGYNLAWAQVNELVRSIRGAGSLVLAGRETFIGRKRVQQDISELREGIDRVDSFTLTPPSPLRAKKWLLDQGLTDEQLGKLEGLLERGSLALRPFFLKQLTNSEIVGGLSEISSGSALNFLIEAMVVRESTKFGGDVDKALSPEERIQFVRNIMREVARDMADNQTASISETTLGWTVDLSTPKAVSQAAEFMLKNRAANLGFLTVDSRPRHLRFYHDKFFEYFLAQVVVATISNREIPKFVLRNIFGSSFLETLSSVLEARLPDCQELDFHSRAVELLANASSYDRGAKNIASFILSTLNTYGGDRGIELSGVEIDEARLVGTASPARLKSCVISQLDARDADLSGIEFVDTNVFTLIVNEDTLVADDAVSPMRLVVVRDGEEIVESDRNAISDWLLQHSLNPPEEVTRLLEPEMYDHPMVRLLGRAARIRQYWLRRGDDKFADRILGDDHWNDLEQLLERNSLLSKEKRQASGTDATFYHIRYAGDILSENRDHIDVVNFYRDVRAKLGAQ